MPVMYEAHPSMIRNRPLLFAAMVALPFWLYFSEGEAAQTYGKIGFVVSPIWLAIWWMRCRTTKLTVTDNQITLRRGLLSRHTSDVFLRDVRNVQVRQGPLQILFDVGYVGISSAGQSGIEIEAYGLPFPGRIKKIVDSQKTAVPLH